MLRHQKCFSPGTSLDAHYETVASVAKRNGAPKGGTVWLKAALVLMRGAHWCCTAVEKPTVYGGYIGVTTNGQQMKHFACAL